MHTITNFLGQRDVCFEILVHRHTLTSRQTAREAHVPDQRIAKGVLFCDDQDYVLAVVPASCRVDAQRLCSKLGRRELALAGEDELALLFPDCEVGAVPALGEAYGLRSVVDAALRGADDVYLEVGDHQHLVRVPGSAFERLLPDTAWGEITGR
ncbi:MAG TPA: YbaK/EbsC family protein [Polyangiales bacterium]|nr:YbaK/EbsC family protein [Polyangiales bacterium]